MLARTYQETEPVAWTEHCEGHFESGHGGLWVEQLSKVYVLVSRLCVKLLYNLDGWIYRPSLSLDFHRRHGILRRHCGRFETSFHTKVTLQSISAVSHRGRGWPRQEQTWQKLWDGTECRQMWNSGVCRVWASLTQKCFGICSMSETLYVCVTQWGLNMIINSWNLSWRVRSKFEVLLTVWIWLSKRMENEKQSMSGSWQNRPILSLYLCTSQAECGLSSMFNLIQSWGCGVNLQIWQQW